MAPGAAGTLQCDGNHSYHKSTQYHNTVYDIPTITIKVLSNSSGGVRNSIPLILKIVKCGTLT
jgi:hypothetical protein